jgi:anti-sigma B factor antagonist
MMKMMRRQICGVTIVDLSGRLTLREGTVMLRDTLRDRLDKGYKQIVLNLGDVTYVDSSGIGELVKAYANMCNQGGEIKLLNLRKRIHDLVQITKLDTVFDVHEDEDSAITAFRVKEATPFPTNQERRISSRFECSVPLRFWVKNGQPHDTAAQPAQGAVTDAHFGMLEGQAQNLSERGVYFVCTEKVGVGQQLEMFFTIPGELTGRGPENIRCRARIVHAEPLERNRTLTGVGAAVPRFEVLARPYSSAS